VPGINTWKGVQRTVRDRAGYTGPIDGKPGVNTYKAMQRYAKAGGGYTGPVDGVLGANSWRGFVARLSS
jgi:peptidoglycan hydrolase-like protein with peptidoglycan-binding domain